MRILVTGGTGMVGNAIKDRVTRDTTNNTWIFAGSKDCDLTDRTSVIEYFEKIKPTHIVHLAANVGGLYKNMRENVNMFTTNVRINENVLEVCNIFDINRGVFVLSSCIYPHKPSKFPMDENMIHESEPHFSNEGYAYAKRMLHLQCKNYNKEYGREYICLVPVNMYGPHDNFNLEDSHVVPAVIHKIYNAKRDGTDYTMFGTGSPLRQFMYVYDFANIVVRTLCLAYDENNNTIVCGEEETTVENMIKIVIDKYDFKGKLNKDLSKSDGCMKKTVHSDRLKRVFPELKLTSLEDGLRLTIDWFVKNYDSCRK